MKLLIVYNTHAGNGKAGKIKHLVEDYLNECGFNYDLVTTAHRGQGIDLVQNTNLENYSGIIAAGGDGTLFEVLNGLFRNPNKIMLPIGIIPVGTGNAFARDLDLHVNDWKAAIDLLKKNSIKKVDVGSFTTQDNLYYFLNIIGLGFVADVGETAHKLKWFGNLSYTLGIIYQTIFLRPTPMKILSDGKSIELSSIFVEVSNSRYTANFLMAPNAKLDDGKLDVTVLRPIGRIKLLKSFPKILTGEHIFMKEVDHYQVENIEIQSKWDKILTPDGELLGTTPVKISCLKEAIEFYWK